jgi:hypothetical protein
MSIINDALKKAGQPIISETQTHRSAGRVATDQYSEKRADIKPTLQVERRKSAPNWGPFFLVGVLLLITGPIVAPMFFNNPSSKIYSAPTDPASTPMNLSAAPKGQYAVEEIPLSPQVMRTAQLGKSVNPLTKFKLSGVVYSEAGSYCLINGKVATQGESVGGAIIEKITASEVVLNYQGEMITLPVEA